MGRSFFDIKAVGVTLVHGFFVGVRQAADVVCPSGGVYLLSQGQQRSVLYVTPHTVHIAVYEAVE